MMGVHFFSTDVSCLFRQYEAIMRRCNCVCIFLGVVLDRDSKAIKISVSGDDVRRLNDVMLSLRK